MQNSDAEENASGLPSQFNTTHWSVVLRAGRETSSERGAALESLCRAYWQPIYFFARRKGYSEEDAKDLTQQFFSNLLERNDFGGLDPRKGKFRTFLLTAFTHFLSDQYDRGRAAKRGGGKAIFSWDELSDEDLGSSVASAESSASKVFDVKWARTIVKQAFECLKTEMKAAGKMAHFAVLVGFLAKEPEAGDYAVAAQKLDVADTSVAVMVHRMRRRYRQLLRSEVAQTVTSPSELDEEMRHLFEVLNQ
jgi:DNA-directed RNA polymerase specialized sigma24 family protein